MLHRQVRKQPQQVAIVKESQSILRVGCSAIRKYLDSGTFFVILALYSSSLDLKLNKANEIKVHH